MKMCVFGEFLCAKNNIWNIFCLWWQQNQQETRETKPWLDGIWIWRRLLRPCGSRASYTCTHISMTSACHCLHITPVYSEIALLWHTLLFSDEKWQILTQSRCFEVFMCVVNTWGPFYPSFYVFGTKNLPFWNKVSVGKPSCASAEIVPTTLYRRAQRVEIVHLQCVGAAGVGAPVLARDIQWVKTWLVIIHVDELNGLTTNFGSPKEIANKKKTIY